MVKLLIWVEECLSGMGWFEPSRTKVTSHLMDQTTWKGKKTGCEDAGWIREYWKWLSLPVVKLSMLTLLRARLGRYGPNK